MSSQRLHDHPLVFDETLIVQVNQSLLCLADNIASPLVLLADVSGRLVHYRGRLTEARSTGLAALAAGSFAATMEIGAFLGLPSRFQQQLLEGDRANLFIIAVGTELLLVTAYTNKTTLGLVRLFAQQTQIELLQLAESAAKAREEALNQSQELAQGFGAALSQQLDEFFSDTASK